MYPRKVYSSRSRSVADHAWAAVLVGLLCGLQGCHCNKIADSVLQDSSDAYLRHSRISSASELPTSDTWPSRLLVTTAIQRFMPSNLPPIDVPNAIHSQLDRTKIGHTAFSEEALADAVDHGSLTSPTEPAAARADAARALQKQQAIASSKLSARSLLEMSVVTAGNIAARVQRNSPSALADVGVVVSGLPDQSQPYIFVMKVNDLGAGRVLLVA